MCFCVPSSFGPPYCNSVSCQQEKTRVANVGSAKRVMEIFSGLTSDMPATPEEKAREENLRNLINSFPLFLREYEHIAKIKWVQYNSLVSAGFTPEQALHLVK